MLSDFISEHRGTLNMCLDVAIADAVSEYSRRREERIAGRGIEELGFLAHELRNLLYSALLALSSIIPAPAACSRSTCRGLCRDT